MNFRQVVGGLLFVPRPSVNDLAAAAIQKAVVELGFQPVQEGQLRRGDILKGAVNHGVGHLLHGFPVAEGKAVGQVQGGEGFLRMGQLGAKLHVHVLFPVFRVVIDAQGIV